MSGSPALTARCEALLAPRIEARIVPGLERIRRVLDALGHPERAFPSVLVLGTNGKGSTAALLASILSALGLRVGLFTSPHLVSVRERIRIAGQPIAADLLLRRLQQLAAFAELSYFETLTAAAVVEFAEQAIDVAVLEAGIGGRWDATRAAGATVTLLTNIGTDHRSWLGAGRVEIAAEKAAALCGREAVVGVWDGEVEEIIRKAADPHTPVSLASDWAEVTGRRAPGAGHRGPNSGSPLSPLPSPLPVTGTPVHFSVAGVTGKAELPLLGGHQLDNLRLALAGLGALSRHVVLPTVDAGPVTRGIEATRWLGRLQWLEWEGRNLLLDGAHNFEAAVALAKSLDALRVSGHVDLLFSCLADKPLHAMAELLSPRVRSVVVTPICSPRATPATALAAAYPGAAQASDVVHALNSLAMGRVTLVTGSLHLVGEVLQATGRKGD